MNYLELETPTLLIDKTILMNNLKRMQDYANKQGVRLRPHTKTHKMPYIAKLQTEMGACGIAVAKIGEAEVMAVEGCSDIFIANEVVGERKLERIASLSSQYSISFGVDSVYHIREAEMVFKRKGQIARVLIEVEVGEKRCGVDTENECQCLLDELLKCENVLLLGFFGHDGNTYNAADIEMCKIISKEAQRKLIAFAEFAKKRGFENLTVSYGSTPPLVNMIELEDGITEIRPGTYSLMDVSQGNAIGSLEYCAASVLSSVISRPTRGRVILDVGAKGLTMQERTVGICDSKGKGVIKEYPDIKIDRIFDEHTIINDEAYNDKISIGDKVRVIPVHICPVCNLYNTAALIENGEVVDTIKISGRGMLQ